MRAYMVSLLKAWWGDAAHARRTTSASTTCPSINGDHCSYRTVSDMIEGKVPGYFLVGENPAVGHANGACSASGLANLEWLVVRDLQMIESATFWKDGPEIATGELRTEDIGTEVFFMPAATHVEKEGTFTHTQRLLQWRHKAVEPPGDCRSDLWFYYHLGRILRERLTDSTDPRDRPLLDLTWDYPTHGETGEPDAEAVLREINGTGPDGRALSTYTDLKDDGSTTSGCWIYCGVYADEVNQAARRKPAPGAERGRAGVGLGVAAQPPDPLQPRLGRPRRQAVERAQEVRLVGRGRRQRGPVTTSPTSRSTKRPDYVPPDGAKAQDPHRRRRPVRHAERRQGLAVRAGACRTVRCRRTTSRRVAGRERALRRAVEPDQGGDRAAVEPGNPRHGARSSRTCSPPTGSPSTTPPAG